MNLGTMVAVLLLTKERYYIVNVGDSRVYEIYENAVSLTKDQTVVAMEVEQGKITAEEAKEDTRRIVVDSIAPTATITFNNPVYMENNVAYYAGNAEAAVRITEANFVPEDVEVTVYRNGADSQKMSVAWTDESVDGHIGRFVLQEDGDYVVQIDYKDRSNNEMQTYRSHQLTIDTQRPEITVVGVTNRSANKELPV